LSPVFNTELKILICSSVLQGAQAAYGDNVLTDRGTEHRDYLERQVSIKRDFAISLTKIIN